MKNPISIFLQTPSVVLIFLLLFGCNPNAKKAKVIPGDDTLTSGTIHISVDESFAPIIDSQLKVFLSQHPKAKIIPHYKSEADCLKDLLDDSTRMVIVTRGLMEDETIFYKDTLGFVPVYGKIATDAIAVITHNKAKDSIFSVSDIRSMLNGTSGYKYQLVMDGLKATSTVRFLIDSVLRGQPLSGKVMAAPNSEGVINYVASNPGAIGFIGVSWIGNREDPSQMSFQKRVRLAALQCANCEEEVFVRPYQANMALRRYPLNRGLYYILKENYAGLGKGFVNFLTHEKGQLIFRRGYLVPDRMALQVRKANVSE
ncbi:MAG: PstS family phosphate ABC transporter substrate-binding protein [Chitinophagia bacterium]|jgi:phosphate transport system substrate-binding protein